MCLAVPYQVVSVTDESATVVRDGRSSTVSLLAAGAPVRAGDWVLVHSGFVLSTLSAAEAAELNALSVDGSAP